LAGVRRVVALGLLLAAGLAGCSGPEGDLQVLAEDLALPGDGIAVDANATAGPLHTDTLWLTPAARLAPTAADNLTILATLAGAVPQSFAWNATVNGTGNLSSARLVLWIDLQNSALQPGIGGDPGCTAAFSLTLVLNGTATVQPAGCASLGMGSIAPGEHRLEFSTLLTAFPDGAVIAPGDGVRVQVDFGLSLPQGVGQLLGGADLDSGLRLVGLAEPVPARTASGAADP
jgi:hypothetical protein